jgi:iron-sulfur cluster repair protein YtfE (RIC family)
MKRGPSLISLSREHHSALILSRLLQKNAPLYKNLPVDTEGKATYASQFFDDELIRHFKNEEEVFAMAAAGSECVQLVVKEIIREHEELGKMFRGIKESPDLTNHLDTLGKHLEFHIRKEERVLFPMIEDTCTKETLTAIEKFLSCH